MKIALIIAYGIALIAFQCWFYWPISYSPFPPFPPFDIKAGDGQFTALIYRSRFDSDPGARVVGIETWERCELIKQSFLSNPELRFIGYMVCAGPSA